MPAYKQIKSLSYLGYSFFLHILSRLLMIKQRNKLDFLQSYHKDRIFPLTISERRSMPSYSSCYACSLCDYYCPAVNQPVNRFVPSYLVMSFSRSLTDFHLLPNNLACSDCNACEAHCPQNVPIKKIIQFMQYGQAQTTNMNT